MYTLGTAANSVGIAKSTVLRAIKAGRISAQRDSNRQWSIDPAEFHRVFPPIAIGATPEPSTALTDALVAQLNATIADLRQDRDHWRAEAADWKAQAQRLLPAPTLSPAPADAPAATPAMPPAGRLRRAWRWMRATGCLAAAGILLALGTGTAAAQQQQRECFAVALNTQALGSILVDRCSGKTWLLGRSGSRFSNAIRWFPLTTDTNEPAGENLSQQR